MDDDLRKVFGTALIMTVPIAVVSGFLTGSFDEATRYSVNSMMMAYVAGNVGISFKEDMAKQPRPVDGADDAPAVMTVFGFVVGTTVSFFSSYSVPATVKSITNFVMT